MNDKMTKFITYVIEIPDRKKKGNWVEAIFEENIIRNFLD